MRRYPSSPGSPRKPAAVPLPPVAVWAVMVIATWLSFVMPFKETLTNRLTVPAVELAVNVTEDAVEEFTDPNAWLVSDHW